MKVQFGILVLAALSLVSAASSSSSGCKSGAMHCAKDGGFNTCDNGKWVHRACGTGTSCREYPKGNIFCDYAKNAGGSSSSGSGRGSCKSGTMRCAKNGGFDTCDNGKWVYRKCGKGTRCRVIKGTLTCA
ncbi:hypothetical protein BGX28_003563 [Mortierella sp. GBA30]|nr:hypothetical protein BGX28_003563 [Mortierella sp. GBA30]